ESNQRYGAALMPQVSVIIPTHNRAKSLQAAITSVLNQTYRDFEIIVVDDASKDNTEHVVRRFRDERIKYIRCAVNKGEAGARNKGVKASAADYIAFLDDDDEWLPRKLELQVALMDSCSLKVGGVYSGYVEIDKTTGRIIGETIPIKRGDILSDMAE